MTEFAFRDATPADAGVIAEIYNVWIVAGGATMDQDLKSVADIRRQMASFGPRETILLLEMHDGVASADRQRGVASEDRPRSVVGWGAIKKYSDRAGYRFCCETAVYVRRDLIEHGLGTRIKRALIERCRRYGYHHLVAKISVTNVASIEYNKNLGYEVVGIQRAAGYAGGRWQDIAILQLVLDDVPAEIPAEYRDPEPPPAGSLEDG